MIIDLPNIRTKFSERASDYQNAEPSAHIAMNDVSDPDTLLRIKAEFPITDHMDGSFTGEIECGKFTESDWEKFGPATQEFLAACNSGPSFKALESLTGIEGLISDPDLSGGGQHQSGKGARLKAAAGHARKAVLTAIGK